MARLRGRSQLLAIDPVELQLGGRAGGVLYMVAGFSGLIHPLLPGAVNAHLPWLLVVSACSLIWGLLTFFVIDWRKVDSRYTHLSTFAAYTAIGIGVWASGGAASFAWIYLVWIALFACYFFVPPVAACYVAMSVLVQAAPLVYDHTAAGHRFVAQLVVSAIGYSAIGMLVVRGKRMIIGLRAQAVTLAAEQQALQRAASAVVRGEHADAVYSIIAAEFSKALKGNLGAVSQFVGPRTVKIVSFWADDLIAGPLQAVGTVHDIGAVADQLRSGSAVKVDTLIEDGFAYNLGCRSLLCAPVTIEGSVWGMLGLGAAGGDQFTDADKQRIEAFAGLLTHIVTSLRDRARLEDEAMTDQLTGICNDRALKQRLESDLSTAERSGNPLSVALIDLDQFKEINDLGGHASGDEALRAVANSLKAAARRGDTVGRLGGDEFMWIMPGTGGDAARSAVERVRRLITAKPLEPKRVTTSAGICDTGSASRSEELLRRADVALYASKARGRNRTTVYDANAALGAQVREQFVEHSQAMTGLRALARAVDAKDPATSDHSERVAEFAALLAQAASWSPDRVDRLREATLVHDVGKLGLPESLLTKAGPLTVAEREQMQSHAEMSAQIVTNVLGEDQVSWIRSHHERPDGGGYPDGLMGEQIPDGAALMALADAWDMMTTGRLYSRPRTAPEAFTECVALRGVQFTDAAVRALIAVRHAGLLGPDDEQTAAA
jgi:diguanylate cyclase (GGDEF)-like protein